MEGPAAAPTLFQRTQLQSAVELRVRELAARGQIEPVSGGDKIITFLDAETGIFMLLFERMHSLRGFTETLTDLYLEPDFCAELADRLVEFNIRVLRNTASAAGAEFRRDES